MSRNIRRTIAGMGAAALMTGAAASTAQGGTNESAEGSVKSPGVNIKFNASNDANGNPSGTFTGEVRIGMQIMEATGPVTCLDVVGNKVGIFYPMASTKPSLLGKTKLMSVYMNITTDGKGNAKSLSYSVVPKKTGGCKPAPTFIPAKGGVKLTGG